MIRNYFVSAIRHLTRHRSYTIINTIGLSLGLACFTVIGHWVTDELAYDRFHSNADQIYRIAATFTDESGNFRQAVTCLPLAPALESDMPEVEAAVRIDVNDAVVQRGDSKYNEPGILGVDPSFLKIFSFRLIKGNPEFALNDPYSVIISQSMAKKYFGNVDPLGEMLTIFQYDPAGNGAQYKVTGVIEDCPRNSHFTYNFLFSFKTIEAASPDALGHDGWFNNGYYTYVLLKRDADVPAVDRKMGTFLEKYIGADMKKGKMYWSYFLQPLTSIHLGSHVRYEIGSTSTYTYIYIFAAIGLVTLVLACINYINLSTAYSSRRFREVGVRKVLGAERVQLVNQYISESWLIAIFSVVVAIAWIELSRPFLESLTGKPLEGLYGLKTMLTVFAIASAVGIVSGVYPSFVLASFKPVNIMKAQFKSATSGAWLRKFLVIFQYSVTLILVIGIFVIQRQMNFIHSTDLGFERENLLILNVNGSNEVRQGYEGFANDLLTNTLVKGVCRSSSFIAGGLGNRTATFTDANGRRINGTTYTNAVDQDYIHTYGMKLIAGRNFREGRSDSAAVIVNEATTKTYGYRNPQDAVGTEAYFGETRVEVIGVVKDFNFNSLHTKVEPSSMYLLRRGFSRIAVRLTGDVNTGVARVAATWKKHFPNSTADFSFAEERVQESYLAEERLAQILFIFSAISFVIACLGLFSLVSFSVEMRVKEIGVRKVLGASMLNILAMLSLEFFILVGIAAVVGIPLGYYFAENWLSSFAYRIDLDATLFISATISVIVIALITITGRSLKAAMLDPVESLKYE